MRCFGSSTRFGDWWLYGNSNVGVLLRNQVTGQEVGGKTEGQRKAVLWFVQYMVGCGVEVWDRHNKCEWEPASDEAMYWTARWLSMRADMEGDE